MAPNDNHLTGNKLIILYIVQQKESISSIELSDFVIFRGYMDYFTLQQYLEELSESGLLLEDASSYSITATGIDVIDTFRSRIPLSVRETIDEFVKTSRVGRSSMLEIDVIITPPLGHGNYIVECLVRDYDQTPFTFKTQVATEAEAYMIRNNWLQKGMSIYRNLISDLRS